MSLHGPADVYTVDEIACAAGVPAESVESLVALGALRSIPGTRFFTTDDIIRTIPALRARTREAVRTLPRPDLFAMASRLNPASPPAARATLLASSGVHLLLCLLVLWLTSGAPATARAESALDPRLVYLMTPGPGGGGGGSGAEARKPPARLERRGADSAVSAPLATPLPAEDRNRREPQPDTSIQQPGEQPPEPLAATVAIAPIVVTAASARDQAGVVNQPAAAPSLGTGTGSDAGAGRGDGHGDGSGAGLGEGSGGGTGGGPFRPGSGIQPPRLLHEVKAEYTEEARSRGISGDVELEIVVRRDGSVGDVTVLRGRGAGLDQRAVAAVRQWRFAPATRMGQTIDVIVQVSVEFTLR
ncbi:MAG TPA: TonB family protein [Vicinamibacterales bacterium]|nr:TonB family protein [Vicinamibacterales bacterium]